MAALMRGLLSKFSQLHVGPKLTQKTEVTLLVSSLKPGLKGGRVSIRTLRSATSSSFESVKLSAKREPLTLQEVVRHPQDTELAVTKDIVSKVNNQIETNSHGRLFAIVHIAGKQKRVTDGDLIMIEGAHPTNVGDIIRIEKILLLGSKDFTLLGRPLLRPDLVRVEATVVEKSLTHTKTLFRNQRRKNNMRINFCRNHFTIMRINCVRIEGLVDHRPEIEGVDGRIF